MPAHGNKGFTLIELLIVISIIAVLATVGLATYSHAQAVGRDGRRRDDLVELAGALENYYQQNGQFPAFSAITIPNAALTSALSQDINLMPSDPLSTSPYYYYYHSSGADYILCAMLEDPSPQDGASAQASDCNRILSTEPPTPPTFYNYGIKGGL